MKQAVVVLLMVGAAFAGGAVVNGPGLRWVQARLLDYMGLKDGGEIASIDMPEAPGAKPGGTTASGPIAPVPGGGSSSNPLISPDPASSPAPAPSGSAVPAPGGPMSGPTKPSGEAPPAASAAAPANPETPPPLPIPVAVPEPQAPRNSQVAGTGAGMPVKRVSQASPPADPSVNPTAGAAKPATGDQKAAGPEAKPPAPLDPSVGSALLAAFTPRSAAGRSREPAKDDSLTLEWAPSSPGAGAASAPAVSSSSTSPAPAASGNADWTALRKKMQTLGVSRYTIEGTPNGRVVFSCLIPLAGRQAVTQRFEGEGDDEFLAAKAALKRVALWQASRQSSGADSHAAP